MDTLGFSIENLPFYRRVLLLQGPVGPFFDRVSNLLRQRGARVTKVNFNSGDDLYYPKGDIVRFTEPLEQWPAYLKKLITEGGYEAIFLFGDCRPVHAHVGRIAGSLDCAVWVFEEGYIRPDFITLERDGVNAFSPLAKLEPHQLLTEQFAQTSDVVRFPNAFRKMAWQAFAYFAAMWLGAWRYPHYTHHKPTGVAEGLRWLRSGARKILYKFSEAAAISGIFSPGRKKRFFVFPLQVHNDAQLHAHGDSRAIKCCLRHVMESFAMHAPGDHWLVIKHHPMDRGHTNYRKIIGTLIAELGLAGRVQYIHDVHLPTLLEHCSGLVVVNSTVGLQGLHHKLPVITLGRSFYNKPGLIYQGDLKTFWTTPWKPDHELYLLFRALTIARTQINSSFYADPDCGSKRGFTQAGEPMVELDLLDAMNPSELIRKGASAGTMASLQAEQHNPLAEF